MSGNERLTPKQEKAIGALITERTILAAAEKIGVSEATIHRWLKDPTFAEAYRKASRHVADTAITRVQSGCTEAVDTLREIMQDKNAPASVRVSSAKIFMDIAINATEMRLLEDRIRMLEEAVSG
ncbi:MAG: hypothetical protein ACYC27_10305 [Armatimonadota bacterium]